MGFDVVDKVPRYKWDFAIVLYLEFKVTLV